MAAKIVEDFSASQATSSLPRRTPIDSLTGFRFIAAMMVVLSHYSVPGLEGTALLITASGYSGVTFSFVLSGFILTYNYLDGFEEGLTRSRVRDYLVARLARVYPLYLLFLIPGWLVSKDVELWPYLLAVQAWSPDVNFAFGLNGPAWSISVEAFLYLVFPLLVPLFSSLQLLASPRRLIAAGAAVTLAMFAAALYFTLSGQSLLSPLDANSAHRWLYRTPATRLGDFLLGMLAAVYVMRFASNTPASLRCWATITLFSIAVILGLSASVTFYRSAFSWDVGYALPGVLLLTGLAINQRTLLAKLLTLPPLLLLGEASYAVYLTHAAVGTLRPVKTGDVAVDIWLYLFFIVLLTALAIGIHVAIERPARRFVRMALGSRPDPGQPRKPLRRRTREG